MSEPAAKDKGETKRGGVDEEDDDNDDLFGDWLILSTRFKLPFFFSNVYTHSREIGNVVFPLCISNGSKQAKEH